MQAEKPSAVHTTGHMLPVAPGILEGGIEFPVRGILPFRMERRPNDRAGQCAKLTLLQPYSAADLVLIEDMDAPNYWHGQISIEGYLFFVRVEKDGRKMAISFLDAIQPIRRAA